MRNENENENEDEMVTSFEKIPCLIIGFVTIYVVLKILILHREE